LGEGGEINEVVGLSKVDERDVLMTGRDELVKLNKVSRPAYC